MNGEAEAYLTIMVYLWLGAFILFVMLGLYAYFWLKSAAEQLVKFINLMMSLYEFEREKNQRSDD